ncbi:MAG: helix-turn-helix transcriptional regulator [Gloeobacteraceae cyanobacterium ES-bin-316]|nr:helix-turn-helix transcriptional regulator [Ferruginibacter sp.]
MIFEFTSKLGFDFITEFSEKFSIPVLDNLLTIPPTMGTGYIRKIAFDKDFRVLIHRYNLKEDLVIKRNASIERNDFMSIFFYNNEELIDFVSEQNEPIKFCQNNQSAIQLTTCDLNSTIKFPANSQTFYCVLGITFSKLATLLGIQKPNSIVKRIIGGQGSFLYFESMTKEMIREVKQLSEISVKSDLSNFYYQIKVQELLYHLFTKLSKRENIQHQIIDNADAEKMLTLRRVILEDLSNPPVLGTLSKMISMSETKMKQLFKQTFGETIYNYYQHLRLDEAAFLLKQAGHSVSKVGYHLGFNNLSHFSRLFERQYGINPKKYSSAG